MRTGIVVALVVSVAVGCNPGDKAPSPPSSQPISADECDWRAAPEPAEADAPLCDVEFREIVRLEGSVDGVAPDFPVHVLRDGTYLTDTYSPGRLALWGPDGQLLQVLGTGPGEGPGEFEYATEFAQISDDEFLVFTGLPLVHRYSTTEGFVRSFRLPTYGGESAATAYGDLVVVAAYDLDRIRGFQISGDSVQRMGAFDPTLEWLLLAAAEGVGLWSATPERYVLRRHMWPGGTAVDSLVVNRDWFRAPEGWVALIHALQADGRGLIWAAGSVPDPDAPPVRRPAGLEAPLLMETEAETLSYIDFFIEAFTPEGRLVASVRLDSSQGPVHPIPGPRGLWYRPSEDELSIVILEATLLGRQR